MSRGFLIVPRGEKYPNASARMVDPNRLESYPEGGGFARPLRPGWLAEWDVVQESNTIEVRLRLARLALPECTSVEGYLLGRDFGGINRWNGWACPSFNRSQIENMCDRPDYEAFMRYNKVSSKLELYDINEEVWDIIPPVWSAELGTWLWAPGSYGWCWEELACPECHQEGGHGWVHGPDMPGEPGDSGYPGGGSKWPCSRATPDEIKKLQAERS